MPVFPLPLVFLVYGLHLAFLVAVLIAVAHAVLWWRFNLWAVLRMERNAPRPGYQGGPPNLPWPRWTAALVVAVAVGLLAPFWWFDDAVEAIHLAAAPENLVRWEQNLHNEDEQQRAIIAHPAPTVDTDPVIVGLRNELADDRQALGKARNDVRCELDGTCGSGEKGPGDIYKEKVKLLNQIVADIDVNLPKKIADRTQVVEEQIESGRQAKAQAGLRHAEIIQELSAPPIWPGRWTALNRVAAGPKVPEAMAVLLAGALAYLVVDLLVLRLVVRRICSSRPAAPRRLPWPFGRPAGERQ